jgi:hypothetical protein
LAAGVAGGARAAPAAVGDEIVAVEPRGVGRRVRCVQPRAAGGNPCGTHLAPGRTILPICSSTGGHPK